MTKNIAIVGLGIGSVYKEQAELKGYNVFTVDANPSTSPTFTDINDLVNLGVKFDLAIICTPNFLHEPHFQQLKNCSDKFIIEKPGFKDLSVLKSIIADNPDKFITVAKNNIYRDWSVKNTFDDIIYNTVNILWVNNNRVPKPGSWFTNKELAFGGVSRDLMPHLLHMYYSLFSIGSPIDIPVFSESNKVWSLNDLSHSEYGEVDSSGVYDVDDHACVKFIDESIPINLISSWKDVNGQESQIKIDFKNGESYLHTIELGLCPNECYGAMMDDIISANDEKKVLFNDIDIWVQTILDNIPYSDNFPQYMNEIKVKEYSMLSEMKTLCLHLTKPGQADEYEWTVPAVSPDKIRVKTIMTGVCRSDIGNYGGLEAMPYSDKEHPNGILGTWGHEGLGVVDAIGSEIINVKVGDYVSTFSDPAYADYYLAKIGEYVKVPAAEPKYILQPVASGINVILETIRYMNYLGYNDETILLVGSGFLSSIIGKYLNTLDNKPKVEIVGRANQELWAELGYKRYDTLDQVTDKYKVIIDLSSKEENFYKIEELIDVEPLICYAATPTTPVTSNFFNMCWKCATIILPSPRNKRFIDAMQVGVDLISSGQLNVDNLWTRGYNRKTEYKKAFEDGLNRDMNYSRGYINWSLNDG